MRDTHAVGDKAVARIIARIIDLGYKVSIPFSAAWSYDLVLDDSVQLYRVQCKNAIIRNGCVRFRTVSTDRTTGKHSLYRSKCDIFLAYCAETDKVYLVPVEDAPIGQVYLRLTKPLNGQEKDIKWAAEYEF